MLSGHSALNKTLFLNKFVTSPLCGRCQAGEETPFHLLSNCVALMIKRYHCFGKAYLSEHDLAEFSTIKKYRFLNKLCSLTYNP